MSTLNQYYEKELHKLKSLAVEFAQENPALAPMLSGPSSDPDVERILEGVAFLSGMVHQKLDDEFPEFVQELANLLFPHYLRPVVSSTLIAFEPKGAVLETVKVQADTQLASIPIDGTSCIFRTCNDIDIHPIAIDQISIDKKLGAIPSVDVRFSMKGISAAQWQCDRIRLFLGSAYNEATKLFLLLMNHVVDVHIVDENGQSIKLGAKAIVPSGFDIAMLPYPSQAFAGFRVLQEFFVQAEKFLFIDVTGIDRWNESARTSAGTSFTLKFLLDSLPDWMPELHSESLMLNIVPAVNLFSCDANPITNDHTKAEYLVSPEGTNPKHYQIYSIDKVTGYQQGQAVQREYRPFGMLSHHHQKNLTYRTTLRDMGGRGSEVYLAVTYPEMEIPQPETLSVQLTCSNRSLPEGLKLGDVSQPTSSSPDRMSFRNIRPISSALNPPSGEALLWRLVGHVALNFLSVATEENLRALLNLYIFSGRQEQGRDAANRRRIDGIQTVTSTVETRLVGRGSVLRGQLIRISCRVDYFAGIGDLYLFGCVLDQFLSNYASINSYTRVEIDDVITGAVFKWPPKLGTQPAL